MLKNDTDSKRTIGLTGATGIGVGAIVGGGILALAGVAFSAAGPGAVAAFALNGFIAILTALSFSELSALFPQSGGTYTPMLHKKDRKNLTKCYVR
jgi:basic amino acid/polyamine antiporter, APA family